MVYQKKQLHMLDLIYNCLVQVNVLVLVLV